MAVCAFTFSLMSESCDPRNVSGNRFRPKPLDLEIGDLQSWFIFEHEQEALCCGSLRWTELKMLHLRQLFGLYHGLHLFCP
jgi:hypothetical protein